MILLFGGFLLCKCFLVFSASIYCDNPECQTTWTPVPNMGAGLVGYNPFIANRLIKGSDDPGLRKSF